MHFWKGGAKRPSVRQHDRRPPTSTHARSSEKYEVPVRETQYSLAPFPDEVETRDARIHQVARGENGAIRRGRVLRNRHQIGARGCPSKCHRYHRSHLERELSVK